MRWTGHVGQIGRRGTVGKKLFEIQRPRWLDNIKMDLGEIELGSVDWIGLAQDRDKRTALANVVMNLRVPQNKIWECSRTTIL
jgi:hypothetical protein